MKTPKDYSDNLKNGVITKDMLKDCLFSVNKRAKNCRDSAKKCCSYDYKEAYQKKKEMYYLQKEQLLKLVEPVCIHSEVKEVKKRYYNYDDEYWWYFGSEKVIYQNGYFEQTTNEYIEFLDVYEEKNSYYLFYDFGNISFHSPIEKNELINYSTLEIKGIGRLVTAGQPVTELVSSQFVRKVLRLIDSGNYRLAL